MGKVVELENTDNYEYVVFNVDEHFRIVTASDVPQWLLQCRDSFGLESSFWWCYTADETLSALCTNCMSDPHLPDGVKDKIRRFRLEN